MYSEAGIRTLRARDRTDLVTAEAICKTFTLSSQRWYRLCRRRGSPRRYKLGNVYCVQAGAMADFFDAQNAIEAGLSLSDVAQYLHMTHYSICALYEAGELPEPIGNVRGRPRWERAAIDAWQVRRLDGGKPPPGIYSNGNRHRPRT